MKVLRAPQKTKPPPLGACWYSSVSHLLSTIAPPARTHSSVVAVCKVASDLVAWTWVYRNNGGKEKDGALHPC